jgi:hypothetical protein
MLPEVLNVALLVVFKISDYRCIHVGLSHPADSLIVAQRDLKINTRGGGATDKRHSCAHAAPLALSRKPNSRVHFMRRRIYFF